MTITVDVYELLPAFFAIAMLALAAAYRAKFWRKK